MTSDRIAELRNLTELREGRIPHFYRDTAGHVTVGIGHLIANVVQACGLSMAPVTAIVPDYAKVKNMQKGLVASAYGRQTTSRMSEAAIDALFESDAQAFISELEESLPKFRAWPDPVQDAVFDMAFNLGLSGFLRYHCLLTDLDAGDFAAAAGQCHRHGISEARNAHTAQLFLQAA